MVNYLIFAGILYSKQIKLPTIPAIEPEPNTLANHGASNCIDRLNITLKFLYKICVHFVMPPPLIFVCLIAVFINILITIPKRILKLHITHCYGNHLCYMHTNVCVVYII